MFLTLLIGAMTVGSLHALAPDHWVPFAAVARGRSWSAGRTARVTFLCGFGHVSVSALLGVLALFVGLEVMKSFGSSMGGVAGILLVGFGLAYGVWGLRRAAGQKMHGHHHHHYDHVHDPSRASVWGLFLLSCIDPCIAVGSHPIRRGSAGRAVGCGRGGGLRGRHLAHHGRPGSAGAGRCHAPALALTRALRRRRSRRADRRGRRGAAGAGNVAGWPATVSDVRRRGHRRDRASHHRHSRVNH